MTFANAYQVWSGQTEDVINFPEGFKPIQDLISPMEAVDFGRLTIELGPGA